MKSPQCLAILFVLLFTLTAKTETPFVLETLWTVSDNQWLTNANITLTGDLKGGTLRFPNEIPANAPWGGATVTDGNIVGTIIVLPQGNVNMLADLSGFRHNLMNNAIIAAAFPDGFHLFRQLSDLFLVSPGITRADIDALDLMGHWFDLQSRTHVGFVQYYPERTLLPTLPPEHEDESEFIKKVRGRSADDYKDGQYTGTADSVLMGLRVLENLENNEYRIVWEQRNVEGAEPSNVVDSLPFHFGGFINADAPVSAAFRVPQIVRELFKDPFWEIQVGIKVIPPVERDEEQKKHFFNFSMRVRSKFEERDDYHLIRDGNTGVFYPKQSEDRPEEEGVLSNAEWDKMNEELAHSFLPFLTNVRESFLSLEPSFLTDFAVTMEDSVLYLASTYSSAQTQIDWNLAKQLMQGLKEHVLISMSPDNSLHDQLDTLFQVKIQEAPETIAGLPGYWVNSWLGPERAVVYAQEPGIIYAAVLLITDDNEVTEEQFAMMQRRLEQKIEDSRLAVAEKMPPPMTVLRSNHEGTRFRADLETTARGYRISVHVAQESFNNVLALGQKFGVGPSLLLPFLRE